MTPLWTAFALFFIPLVGAYVGFDLAFRVTAYRTREIVLHEIDADAVYSYGGDTNLTLEEQRERRAAYREEAIQTGRREGPRRG